MANVVLVVDMLDGFLKPGRALYCGDNARRIIPHVQRLIQEEQAKGSRVIFICDTHDPDDLEFQMFPPHCIRGTEEARVIPELQGYAGEVLAKLAESRCPHQSLTSVPWCSAGIPPTYISTTRPRFCGMRD